MQTLGLIYASPFFELVVGMVLLYGGGEWLVQGSSRLARSLAIRPLVIGLTIVAFGTSAPELVTSLLSGLQGLNDIAIGNVIGSNILNVTFILGLAALIHPIRVEMQLLKRETPLLVGVSLLLYPIVWNGTISRWEGTLMLAGLAAYTVFTYRAAAHESERVIHEYEEFFQASSAQIRNLIFIGLGLLALVLGARLFVGGAVAIAQALDVSERMIGLTIVAAGTSLPELATSVVASVRKEGDISAGNIVGSNLFNILGVLGATALATPLRVDPGMLSFELPIMLLTSLILIPFLVGDVTITRMEGGLLVAGYLGFVAWGWFG